MKSKHNYTGKSTICWQCANANGLGCSWHRFLVPVKGWDATRRDVRVQSTGKTPIYIESYLVLGCPEFVARRVEVVGDG